MLCNGCESSLKTSSCSMILDSQNTDQTCSGFTVKLGDNWYLAEQWGRRFHGMPLLLFQSHRSHLFELLILLDGRFLLKRSFPQSGPNSARLLFTIIGSLHITLSPFGHVMGIFSFAPVDHGDHGMLLDEMYHILKTHPPKCTKREWFGGSQRDGWVHWRPFTRVLPPTYIP